MATARRMLLVVTVVVAVVGGSTLVDPATGQAGGVRTAAAPTSMEPGYWLAGADGGVFAFGAPFYGSGLPSRTAGTLGACTFTPQAPSPLNPAFGCTAIAAPSNGGGYWLLNAFRQAAPLGGVGLGPQGACTSLNGARGSWVGMASSASGAGYWLVSSNGAVLGCGDVPAPSGGLTTVALDAPIVGMAATPDGGGYWLVASDGGVFAFGEAVFAGSMGGHQVDAPIVGMAATAVPGGYWLAASDGGVFAFGGAPFLGSMGGKALNASIVGIAAA
jgi:hypothetical protein